MSPPAGERDHRDDDVLVAYRQLIAEVYELAGRSRRSSDVLAREVGQTAARWHLMSVLTDGPRSVSAAARRLGLARQSVQRVANELVRGGLARSEPDPDDARAPRLCLTEAGRRVTSELFARSEERRAVQLARAGLTSDDLVSARIVVRQVCSAIEPPGDDHSGRPVSTSGVSRNVARETAWGALRPLQDHARQGVQQACSAVSRNDHFPSNVVRHRTSG